MRTIEWTDNNTIRMIDQRQIPWSLSYVEYDDYREVAAAITDMVVRGAPAIGVAAAYGMALAAHGAPAMDVGSLLDYLDVAAVNLKKARPTAVNLAWAVDHMLELARDERFDRADDIRAGLLDEARRMADEDVEINQRIAAHGAALLKDGDTMLHHCNTGILATVDYGTALGVIRWRTSRARRSTCCWTRRAPGCKARG